MLPKTRRRRRGAERRPAVDEEVVADVAVVDRLFESPISNCFSIYLLLFLFLFLYLIFYQLHLFLKIVIVETINLSLKSAQKP